MADPKELGEKAKEKKNKIGNKCCVLKFQPFKITFRLQIFSMFFIEIKFGLWERPS